MSMYNYVVTAQKPTATTHSIVANLSGPDDDYLIIAKCTRLEIYILTKQGVKPLMDVPIYGRISALQKIRIEGKDRDWIFLATERYNCCLLSYNRATQELKTEATGNFEDPVGRVADNGHIGVVDPDSRVILMHLYDGVIKLTHVVEGGCLDEAYNCRLEELKVYDIVFLHGCAEPTFVVLFQDGDEGKSIKAYRVNMEERETEESEGWGFSDLDLGSAMLIPVPAPLLGVLVVGDHTLTYHDGSNFHTVQLGMNLVRAFETIDSRRFLLGDQLGHLALVTLIAEDNRVLSISVDHLGITSAPSTISYLDNSILYLGSSHGDSQLIRLSPAGSDIPGVYLDILDTFLNIGPLVDFCFVDTEKLGQGQMVTCSGAFKEGSLRVIRSGIGLDEQASLELPGMKGLWSLKAQYSDEYDTYLVVTFVGETRVLALRDSNEMEETEVPGFLAEEQTIFCGNIAGDKLLQATRSSLCLVNSVTLTLVDSWEPPAGVHISVATANPTQALISTSDLQLTYLDLSKGSLHVVTSRALDCEVSCLDISPVSPGALSASLAGAGMWTDTSVRLFGLPGLQETVRENMGGDVIARSLVFSCFDEVPYVLAGLGDGHLVSMMLDPISGKLSEKKKLSLGTQPLSLRPFQSKGKTHIFAASDRPMVVHSSNKKLLYSNVNLRNIAHVCQFNSRAFPDSLALAVEGNLSIGTIDEIQKLHIRTVPLGEQPRRILHVESSRALVVLTQCQNDTASTPHDYFTGFVRLLDDLNFESLGTYQLQKTENASSITECFFADDPTPYVAVGTAFVDPEETQPSKGRILLFTCVDRRLQLVYDRETRGAAHSLRCFQGRLLASVNNKVQLFSWASTAVPGPQTTALEDMEETGEEQGPKTALLEEKGPVLVPGPGTTPNLAGHELQTLCTHHGHVSALFVETSGDLVLVGDLMRSMSLLKFKAEESALEAVAHHSKCAWMTAIQILNKDTFLGAENGFNLFTVGRTEDSYGDEVKAKLEVTGEFHVGLLVNKIRPGSLVMRLPEVSELSTIPTLICVTVEGAILVVAGIAEEHYGFLHRLQKCINDVVKGVGSFSHKEWRSFCNEQRAAFPTSRDSMNFIDGDLIESYLDLKKSYMEDVAKAMQMTVEDLTKKVEEFNRMH